MDRNKSWIGLQASTALFCAVSLLVQICATQGLNCNIFLDLSRGQALSGSHGVVGDTCRRELLLCALEDTDSTLACMLLRTRGLQITISVDVAFRSVLARERTRVIKVAHIATLFPNLNFN